MSLCIETDKEFFRCVIIAHLFGKDSLSPRQLEFAQKASAITAAGVVPCGGP